MKNNKTSILFVCMGNICRSPAGEAILKDMAQKDSSLNIHTESCGMGDWHVGQSPDSRIQEAALARGLALTSRAKQFQPRFLADFDYILAADQEVLQSLYQYVKTPEQKAKIFLMTAFSSIYKDQEIPDPYRQSKGAFEQVLDMLEDSCRGLLQHIRGSLPS